MAFCCRALVALASLGALARGDLVDDGHGAVRRDEATLRRTRLRQRLDASRARASALHIEQRKLLDKLEKTVKVEMLRSKTRAATSASASLASRMLEGEIAKARDALIEQMQNHMGAMKAEMHFLRKRSPVHEHEHEHGHGDAPFEHVHLDEGEEIKYSRVADMGKMIEDRSRDIGDGMAKMVPLIPPMMEASDKYKHQNFVLQEAVGNLHSKLLPQFFKSTNDDKKKELHELQMIDLTDAYTPRMRMVKDWAQPKDIEIVKRAPEAPPLREVIKNAKYAFGEDPYAKLSNTHWEHREYEPWERDVESIHISVPPVSGDLDTAPSQGQVS